MDDQGQPIIDAYLIGALILLVLLLALILLGPQVSMQDLRFIELMLQNAKPVLY